MKLSVFNALTNVETPAAALLLSNGTYFLFMDTQVHGVGTRAAYGDKGNSQQRITALRHKIVYYVRDTSHSVGYYPVYDILEADDAATQTKTVSRNGFSRATTRDDDDSRNVRVDKNWS